MQRATFTGIRIRSPADARVIFHSVYLNILPMVTRRLDTEERSLISSGSVYVWEERGQHAELTGVGIERWTDGIRWGPSRVREGFLFYHEKPSAQQLSLYNDSSSDPMRSVLIKQTYTVYVNTHRGQRKWHLIAYFTEDTLHRLQSIDDIPRLASLTVPAGQYISARSPKGRPDHSYSPESDGSRFTQLEYVPYAPFQAPSASPPELLSTVNQSIGPSSIGWSNSSANQGQRMSCTRPLSQSSSGSESSEGNRVRSQGLVPLSYLEDQPPPRRHPNDEKVLMMLTSRCFQDRQNWLHSSLGSRSGAVTRWNTIQ